MRRGAFEWDKGTSDALMNPVRPRRGAFEWETIAKYLIAFVILIILILLIGLFKDKLLNVLDAAKVMFGG